MKLTSDVLAAKDNWESAIANNIKDILDGDYSYELAWGDPKKDQEYIAVKNILNT